MTRLVSAWRRTPSGIANRRLQETRRRAAQRATSDASIAIKRIHTAKRVTCYYCGKRLIKNEITIDHIVPISKGGLHAGFNIVPACLRCNQSKNNNSVNRFITGQQLLEFHGK